MKNYFSFLVLFLALVFSTEIYASEILSDNKKGEISVTKKSGVSNIETTTFGSTEIISSPKEHIKVEYYGVLCRMTVSGETSDGIKYTISGRCRKVRRMLKSLGVI